MEDPSKEYIAGFNKGYLIAQHEPATAIELTQNHNIESDFFKGLTSGIKEYEIELKKPSAKQQNEPEKNIEKDKDIER